MDANQLLAVDVRTRQDRQDDPRPRRPRRDRRARARPRLRIRDRTRARSMTINAQTGAVLARAPAGAYPGRARLRPRRATRLRLRRERRRRDRARRRGHRIATIALGGEAGNVQYDAGSGHILVDVQTRDDIAVIDPRTNRIVRRVPLPGCAQPARPPRRLAATARLRRLRRERHAAHARPAHDDASPAPRASAARPDVLAFDSSLRRLYVAAESGVVAVFAEHAHSLTKLGQAFLATEAHTVAVDPRTHLGGETARATYSCCSYRRVSAHGVPPDVPLPVSSTTGATSAPAITRATHAPIRNRPRLGIRDPGGRRNGCEPLPVLNV